MNSMESKKYTIYLWKDGIPDLMNIHIVIYDLNS